MATAVRAGGDAPVMMQGIAVPSASIDPETFFRATRKMVVPQRTLGYAGLGGTDNISILQHGIISGLWVKFSGVLTVNLGGGTCATTAAWPYNLIRNLRFAANGQSNLINVSGWDLKAREIMARGDYSDRGISRGSGGASPGTTVTQGTLSMASENWGVNNAVTAIPGAPTNYNVDLNWFVPIAFDQVDLIGAIFAQTATTDLNLSIDWASSSELFTLTGAATAALTGSCVVEAIVYSIPQGDNGSIIIPDLSAFHSLIKTRFGTPTNGENEVRLAGQGIGRQLLRVFARTLNGATPAPLVVNSTNYGPFSYRFGGNDTPEQLTDGLQMRQLCERIYSSDIGAIAGYFGWDFAHENALRDSIDMGAATELRVVINIGSGVTLNNAAIEYVQETVFAGSVGA